jgi:UDP-glucose 4-epimerase
MEIPESAYITDIPLLLKTLDTCVAKNKKRIIYASSGGTVYGESIGLGSKESDFENPINHYAICKISCEKILQLYNKLYNMENIILRISNPYGKGQNPSSGVGAITTFISQILNNQSITIYGDGNNVRDFINIEAVAEAFSLAIEWPFDRNIIPIFNVGSGHGMTLNEIIDIIAKVLEVDPSINYESARPFDVRCNYLDMTKTEQYLNFYQPNNFKEKIAEYVLEFKKHNTK